MFFFNLIANLFYKTSEMIKDDNDISEQYRYSPERTT